MSGESRIGRRIKEARRKAGLTQEELARRVGVSSITVSRWETGAIQNPGSVELARIARALDVPERWLISGETAPTVAPAPVDPPQWAEFVRRYEFLHEFSDEELEDIKGFAARNLPVRSWTDYERVAEIVRGARPSPTFEAKKRARRARS